ncbi:phosphatase, partial [Streptomyces sp. SID11385]|nr:phosphatase [Streptomyces sp. SID11385]
MPVPGNGNRPGPVQAPSSTAPRTHPAPVTLGDQPRVEHLGAGLLAHGTGLAVTPVPPAGDTLPEPGEGEGPGKPDPRDGAARRGTP